MLELFKRMLFTIGRVPNFFASVIAGAFNKIITVFGWKRDEEPENKSASKILSYKDFIQSLNQKVANGKNLDLAEYIQSDMYILSDPSVSKGIRIIRDDSIRNNDKITQLRDVINELIKRVITTGDDKTLSEITANADLINLNTGDGYTLIIGTIRMLAMCYNEIKNDKNAQDVQTYLDEELQKIRNAFEVCTRTDINRTPVLAYDVDGSMTNIASYDAIDSIKFLNQAQKDWLKICNSQRFFGAEYIFLQHKLEHDYELEHDHHLVTQNRSVSITKDKNGAVKYTRSFDYGAFNSTEHIKAINIVTNVEFDLTPLNGVEEGLTLFETNINEMPTVKVDFIDFENISVLYQGAERVGVQNKQKQIKMLDCENGIIQDYTGNIAVYRPSKCFDGETDEINHIDARKQFVTNVVKYMSICKLDMDDKKVTKQLSIIFALCESINDFNAMAEGIKQLVRSGDTDELAKALHLDNNDPLLNELKNIGDVMKNRKDEQEQVYDGQKIMRQHGYVDVVRRNEVHNNANTQKTQ